MYDIRYTPIISAFPVLSIIPGGLGTPEGDGTLQGPIGTLPQVEGTPDMGGGSGGVEPADPTQVGVVTPIKPAADSGGSFLGIDFTVIYDVLLWTFLFVLLLVGIAGILMQNDTVKTAVKAAAV